MNEIIYIKVSETCSLMALLQHTFVVIHYTLFFNEIEFQTCLIRYNNQYLYITNLQLQIYFVKPAFDIVEKV